MPHIIGTIFVEKLFYSFSTNLICQTKLNENFTTQGEKNG